MKKKYVEGGLAQLQAVSIPDVPAVITFTSTELTTRCALLQEVDFYTLVITFKQKNGQGLELVSLRKYLWSFRSKEYLAEALAVKIWRDIQQTICPCWVLVTLREQRGYTTHETTIGERV